MKNKQKYWFKRKRYGYGWVPTTIEGWSLTIAFIISLVVVSEVFIKEDNPKPAFIPLIILLSSIFIYLIYKKGPKPKWRWGKKPKDNPNLDF